MKEYLLSESAGIGGCMDVKAYGGALYAIQKDNQAAGGRLCVLSPDLTLLHTYEGIGNARQIEIADGVAVITAREDGLWLVDVTSPVPRLLSHYRTVEYATGVALCGGVAFVSCRQYGVEMVDIRDPRAPRHIGLIRIGEVQSACVADGILYGGVWGKQKVVVVDVHDLTCPHVLAEIPLMGRGDGVAVRDGILYAASGQHARGLKNSVDHDDPAFGMGNGVEAFDVRDPAHPRRLTGQFFGKAYCASVDMWEPGLYGELLVVNNSVLGVFALDPTTLTPRFRLLPPPLSDREDAVTGVTALGGDLFVATAYGSLYAFRKVHVADQDVSDGAPFAVPAPTLTAESDGRATLSVRYGGNFPVLDAVAAGERLYLACAEGGVHILDRRTLAPVTRIDTAGHAQCVRVSGETLCVASAEAGVEVFRMTEDGARKIGAWCGGKSVFQLALSTSGRYLLCACGADEVRMLDIGDPTAPRSLYARKGVRGPLYGNNFAVHTLADGTMLCFWHRDGLIYTDPDGGDRVFHDVFYPMQKGFVGYCSGEGIDTDGENILFTRDGGYILLPMTAPAYLEQVPVCRAERPFRGLFSLNGGTLVASWRAEGVITVLDVSDIAHPHMLAQVTTNASPSTAVFVDGRILLPAGRGGLLEITIDT